MIFLAARRDGVIGDNPAEDVKTVSMRGTPRVRRPFSIDELRAVLAVADAEWRGMILFALNTGARLADVAMLTWQNIDLSSKEIRYTASVVSHKRLELFFATFGRFERGAVHPGLICSKV